MCAYNIGIKKDKNTLMPATEAPDLHAFNTGVTIQVTDCLNTLTEAFNPWYKV